MRIYDQTGRMYEVDAADLKILATPHPTAVWEANAEPFTDGSYAVVECVNGMIRVDSRVVAWVRPKP